MIDERSNYSSTSRHRKITIILQLSSHKQTDKAIEETLFLECIAVICINFTFTIPHKYKYGVYPKTSIFQNNIFCSNKKRLKI